VLRFIVSSRIIKRNNFARKGSAAMIEKRGYLLSERPGCFPVVIGRNDNLQTHSLGFDLQLKLSIEKNFDFD